MTDYRSAALERASTDPEFCKKLGLTPQQLAIARADSLASQAGLPCYSALLLEMRILANRADSTVCEAWRNRINAAWAAYLNTEGR